MKTNYIIRKAPQGTSDQEITKAKRLYNKACKKGVTNKHETVHLQFNDMNGYRVCYYFIPELEGASSFIHSEKLN
jgi:hypothetical protein